MSSAQTALTASRITSACSSSSTLLTTSSIVILSAPAIAGASFRRRCGKPDDHGRHGGRNRFSAQFRPTRSYTNPRDMTRRERAMRTIQRFLISVGATLAVVPVAFASPASATVNAGYVGAYAACGTGGAVELQIF